jgi:hypothetical protein
VRDCEQETEVEKGRQNDHPAADHQERCSPRTSSWHANAGGAATPPGE